MCISLYKFLILIFFLDSEKCVGEVYDELEISDPGYESLDDRTVIHLVPGNNNKKKKKKKTSPAGFFVFRNCGRRLTATNTQSGQYIFFVM